MRVKYITTLAVASILSLGIVAGCSNPCSGKTKSGSGVTTETNSDAVKGNPCASKDKNNPCASKDKNNPCASKDKNNPCASKDKNNPCASKDN